MSEENKDIDESGQERDGKGRFTPKTQTESNGQSSPTEGDYTKMNAILQKQSGMSAEKFVEYQRKLTPRELFNQLNFLVDNIETPPPKTKEGGGLPPNKDFVPTSPGGEKVTLPGRQMGVQKLGKEEKFGLHLAFDPRELFTPKKKE